MQHALNVGGQTVLHDEEPEEKEEEDEDEEPDW